MSNTVYVTGHRSPDTDSICSAIGYAALKCALGMHAVPARLGKVSRETAFVLSAFHQDAPYLLTSVRGQIRDVELKKVPALSSTTNMQDALKALYAHKEIPLPLVDASGILLGLVSLADISALALTFLSGEVQKSAKELQQKFHQLRVSDAMQKGKRVLHENDCVDDVREILKKSVKECAPVVDEQGKYLGFCNLEALDAYQRKQLILVDHSERAQTVDGLDEADLLEVIDHHRIGDITTATPIYFRNEPVGCSATIIATLYEENKIKLEAKIAGLLCSAILSDTVKFKSPTCTPRDKETALHLAKIAGIDIDTYANQMFEAGASLEGMSPDEIIHNDFKEYILGGRKLGIAQVTMATLSSFSSYRDAVIKRSAEMLKADAYDAVLVLVTAILDEKTEVLFKEAQAGLVAKAFADAGTEGSFMMNGVISRKKQIIPQLTRALA